MRKILFSLVFLLFSSFVFSYNVNVMLNDESVITGELIGISSNEVIIKDSASKIRTLKKEIINNVFRADNGAKVEFIDAASSGNPAPSAGAGTTTINSYAGKFAFAFGGTLGTGVWASVPCLPIPAGGNSSDYEFLASIPAVEPDFSYSFGLNIEYFFDNSINLSFDGFFNSWEKMIAQAYMDAYGGWVYEESGYTNAVLDASLFDFDVYYYMDTTFMRLGVKYYFMEGMMRPWGGIAAGAYAWQATIGSKEEEKKWAQASGTEFSYAFLAGVDFFIDEFFIRIFAEGASPVAAVKFEDLFYNGWDFETSGVHITSPYKFGISIGMLY